MHIKKTNRFFLFAVIVGLVSMFALDSLPKQWGISDLIPYLLVFFASLLAIKRDGAKFFDVLPYNKKISAREIILIIALTLLMFPVSNVFSEIGTYLTGDILDVGVAKMQESGGDSLLGQVFVIAVIPAIFEELYFRGYFFAGYRKYRGARTAIILSSILFGLFHMNFQQFLYAMVLGIVIAVIRELTGSMWAGMLYHFVNNGLAAIVGYIGNTYKSAGAIIEKYGPISNLTFEDTGHTIYSIVMFVVAIPVMFVILKAIAKGRGREDDFKNFFKGNVPEEKERLISASLITGIILYLLMCLVIAYAFKSGAFVHALEA